MEPSQELAALTRRIAEAVSAGDATFLRHTAGRADLAFLGTAPDNWWTDITGLTRALAAQHGAGVEVLPGEPLAYQEGDVGWAVDRGLRFRVGGEEFPFRMSAVYHREDGEWKLIHFHCSVGVPDAEAVGRDVSR